jgi:hypothetical protein
MPGRHFPVAIFHVLAAIQITNDFHRFCRAWRLPRAILEQRHQLASAEEGWTIASFRCKLDIHLEAACATISSICRNSRRAIFGNVTVTSVGFARSDPKVSTSQVSADHHFEWSDGRILQSYQFILISEVPAFPANTPAHRRG